MKVTTRKEALELGLNRYFTGKPCVNGHVAERYTCNKTCVVCEAQRKAKARAKKKAAAAENVKTELKVVGRKVRIVRFVNVGSRIGAGKRKFMPVILEDEVVNL